MTGLRLSQTNDIAESDGASVEEDRISTKRALCGSVQNQVIDKGII